MRIKKTVYTHDAPYAREHGELEAYRESNKINQQCAAAIYQAIADSNYEPNHYDLKTAAAKMIDEYGVKRVTWVLANTVNIASYDGRYTRSNKEWAKSFDTLDEPGRSYHVKSHPCLVDGFIDRAREVCAERELAAAQTRAAKREVKRSLIEQLHSEQRTPEPDSAQTQDKYTLEDISEDEAPLFYDAPNPERDIETGCIGALRADFGKRGDEFWSTFFDHNADLKTQVFRDELDSLINTLRESGPLKNRTEMSAYCYENNHAMLDDGRNSSFGFRIKTDSHVFYLRFNPMQGDYNLYCYAYERSRLEKCFPALAPVKPSLIGQLTNPPATEWEPGTLSNEIRALLEKAVEHIVKTCAEETTTGHYYVEASDFPAEILAPGLFDKHIKDITAMMLEYESVAEADVEGATIDTIMYLDYCPNYEPDPDEIAEGLSYALPDREILDPLTKKAGEPERDQPGDKPKKSKGQEI